VDDVGCFDAVQDQVHDRNPSPGKSK
jgi:hypothetical protein